jgi:hypothetical protein
MKSMDSLLTILLGACIGAGGACSSAVLMSTPVSKTAEGWALTLGQVKEGPNEYLAEGGVAVEAGEDQKLVWAVLTVLNKGAQDETFSYETCLLSGPGQARPPSVVDRHSGEVNSAADMAEAISQGQERTRQLVYTYAKDQRPTMVKCGPIVLPIKTAR